MKAFRILLAIASIILTVYNVCVAFFSKTLINLVSLANIIPMLAVIYLESENVYRKVNKFVAWFRANTVGFDTYLKFKIDEDNTELASDFNNSFFDMLHSNNYEFKRKDIQKFEDDFVINNLTKNGVKFSVSNSRSSSHDGSIKFEIKFNFQVSYRDVKNSWLIFDKIQRAITEGKNIKDKTYSFSLYDNSNNKFNPFYKLIVKNIDPVNVKKFELKYTENKVKISTFKNKIYASGADIIQLGKIISDYIPFTKLF